VTHSTSHHASVRREGKVNPQSAAVGLLAETGHRPAARALVELEGGVGRAADGVEWSVLLIPARRVHSAHYALLGDHEHGRLVVEP